MGNLSRQPTSNDPPPRPGKSPWLNTTLGMDEFALLLNGFAGRCQSCKRATNNSHLNDDKLCPDCRKEEAIG